MADDICKFVCMGAIGQFTVTHYGASSDGNAGYEMVDNTITGRAHVLSRADIVVNCDDPMVDCRELHHILQGPA